MKKSHFLGWMFRLGFIRRWDRMDVQKQTDVNLHSHCLNVAVVSHLLGVIRNTIYGGNVNADRLAVLAMYHEMAESITSDIISPIKYANKEIAKQFKLIEDVAEKSCVKTLPVALQGEFEGLIIQENVDAEYKRIIKAADIIVALSKAKEEVDVAKNMDFIDAKTNLANKLDSFMDMKEVAYFVETFTDGYAITIDKLMSANELNAPK
jgi:5'-deoxynucleotidase